MPYIEGESLRDRLTRERQLPIADAVRLTREAALALDFAHRQGVVHRDIKPENILLVDGQALVADFGIARAIERGGGPQLTETGVSIGTPAYMSPEQSVGDKALDARTDIYSLGTVLYEMLAGETPFSAPTAQAMIARRITETPRPLQLVRETVPDAVAQAVTRALAKAPADRFATAAEFARALDPATPAATAPCAPRQRRICPVRQRPHPRWPAARPVPRSCAALSPWPSDWASCSASACCSAGSARAAAPSRPARAPPSWWPCCRSRTWATRATSTSPTASPTKCAASSPRCPGCR